MQQDHRRPSIRVLFNAFLIAISASAMHCTCDGGGASPKSGFVVPKLVEPANLCETYAVVACNWYKRCFPEGLDSYRPKPAPSNRPKQAPSESTQKPKIELCIAELSSPCVEVLSFYKVQEGIASGKLDFNPEEASEWLQELNERDCEDNELSIAPESLFRTQVE